MKTPENGETAQSSAGLPTTPAMLFDLLAQLGIVYSRHDHPPIYTVAEGEPFKEDITGLHCRNLFLRDKKAQLFLVVLGNDTPVDLGKLAARLGCSRLSFGSPERLFRHLGIRPGSVCPFCLINDPAHQVTLVLESAMMQAERVCYHPLDNAITVGLSPADLMRFFVHTGHMPHIVDFESLAPE